MASVVMESVGVSPNGTAEGLGSFTSQLLQDTTIHYIAITAAVIFSSLLLYSLSSPRTDPREPPILKPAVPFVGHIVGLVRHGVDFFDILRYCHLA
jgi:hypothetical protein